MRILRAWLIVKLLKIKTYNKTKKNQAYRFIRRFGALFGTRTILGFTRACCKWMLRAESFTKRLKIFNFSRAYNHHVIFKQPIKTKQNWRALGLNTFTRFHPPFSPPLVTSLFRFEQSAATRLFTGLPVCYNGGFQSGARLSGEAATEKNAYLLCSPNQNRHATPATLEKAEKVFKIFTNFT